MARHAVEFGVKFSYFPASIAFESWQRETFRSAAEYASGQATQRQPFERVKMNFFGKKSTKKTQGKEPPPAEYQPFDFSAPDAFSEENMAKVWYDADIQTE